MNLTTSKPCTPPTVLAAKAASSALLQSRRGTDTELRELYYEAHSLLRTLRHYLPNAA